LLGTDGQGRLAANAARELAEGGPVHTAELVESLRAFIRSALGLAGIPADVTIPRQMPTRPSPSGGRGGGGGGMAAGGAGLGLGLVAGREAEGEER
jgi:hypothetical protein